MWLTVGLTISACGQSFNPSQQEQLGAPGGSTKSVTATSGDQTTVSIMSLMAGTKASNLSICSKLDFSDLDWSSTLDPKLHDALALALNISGSFEGGNGWQNLTNNFDGQGWSYGLLNQCLGQGSLQPLLIKMRDNYASELKGELSPANLNSLDSMLNQWQGRSSAAVKAEAIRSNPITDLSDYGLSSLDDPEEIKRIMPSFHSASAVIMALSRNQASVDWAVNNLYNGSRFKPDWKAQLIALAQTPGYRSIQVGAALKIHNTAFQLFQHFDLKELRSYLFFFDIAVQNGGLPAVDISTLDRQFANNRQMSETQKLTSILELRLTHVKKIYRQDVRSRKMSIITGKGAVHGASRNYNREYCANLESVLL